MIGISAVIFLVVSHLTDPQEEEKIDKYTFSKDLINLENDDEIWFKDYRYQAVFLIALILATLISLW